MQNEIKINIKKVSIFLFFFFVEEIRKQYTIKKVMREKNWKSIKV